MGDMFSPKWMVSVVVAWLFIILISEIAYYWWKDLNPGSTWSGIIDQQPPVNSPDQVGTSVANGYRPAGGP